MIAKRTYAEEEMKIFNERLKKIDDFIATNNTSTTSSFTMGSITPTMLDIHMYACLSRPFFVRDSAFHDELWKKMNFGH